MFKRFVLVVGAVVMAAASLIVPAATHAAVVIGGGASLYTNALSGATMTGEIGGGGSPSAGTLSDMTASATEFVYSKNLRYQGTPTTSSITATLGGSANVGTILSVLNYPGPSGSAFSNGADWAFSINASTVGSGSASLNAASSAYGGIQFVTLASPQSATTVTMSLSNLPNYFGQPPTTHYADYHYFVALSKPLKPVTTLTATSPVDGGAPYVPGNAIVFASNPDSALESSFWAGPTNSGYLQIGLGGSTTLDGLLLGTYPNTADLIIKDDQGNTLATVSNQPASDGLLLPIKFATPVTTTYLRLEPGGAGTFALNEVIPLAEVPEPASFGLLAIGVATTLLRRRARGR